MKQINFVPPQIAQRHHLRRLLTVSVFAILLGFGLSGAVYLSLYTDYRMISTQVTGAQNLLDQGKQKVVSDQAKLYDADAVNRITQLNTLSNGEISWPKAFSEVQKLLPQDITLTSCTYAVGSNALTLTMNGTAPSSLSFATFAQSLKTTYGDTEVTISTFSYNPATRAATFSLTVEVPFKNVTYKGA